MSFTTLKTTGQLRRILLDAVGRSAQSKLSRVDGQNMIGLANQITRSLAVELQQQKMQQSLQQDVTPLNDAKIVNP